MGTYTPNRLTASSKFPGNIGSRLHTTLHRPAISSRSNDPLPSTSYAAKVSAHQQYINQQAVNMLGGGSKCADD